MGAKAKVSSLGLKSSFPLFIALSFFLVILGSEVSGSIQVFSTGYLSGKSGELSRTRFDVTPAFPGENIPVRLYFSEPALSDYFRLESDSANWNGAGFFSLTKTQTVYLSVERVPTALSFENHTVYVEMGGTNYSVSYFPIPGEFYFGGREPPPGVSVTRAVRQTYFVSPASGLKIPVEMGVYVW